MGENKKFVVSFANGVGHYAKAMLRLEQSLRSVGFGGEFEIFKGVNDLEHIGSPHHRGLPGAVPYAFKAHAIKKAMDEGAEDLLWMDSVVYATKEIHRIWEHIQRDGYLFFDNLGFSVGDYTSDSCLAKHGMTREDAFRAPMIMACVMGFHVSNPVTKKFLERYIAAATDGVSYQGCDNIEKSWTNEDLQVSQDMRCKGHRHDQSVASIIINQMNLKITNAQQTYFAYEEHKGRVPINFDSVCLWSGGI
jgi:hypothetical protein